MHRTFLFVVLRNEFIHRCGLIAGSTIYRKATNYCAKREGDIISRKLSLGFLVIPLSIASFYVYDAYSQPKGEVRHFDSNMVIFVPPGSERIYTISLRDLEEWETYTANGERFVSSAFGGTLYNLDGSEHIGYIRDCIPEVAAEAQPHWRYLEWSYSSRRESEMAKAFCQELVYVLEVTNTLGN